MKLIVVTQREAARCVEDLLDLLEAGDGDPLYRALLWKAGRVPAVFGSLALLADYVRNSKAIALTSQPTPAQQHATHVQHLQPRGDVAA